MRKEKQYLLDGLKDKIEQSDAFVLLRYLGLKADEAANLHQEIAKAGGEFEVVKKRVFVKAAAAADIEIDVKTLDGHIGVAFASTDAVGTAKAAVKFAKDSDEKLSVVGGHVDGQVYGANEMVQFSKLPSRDEMRAQFVALLQAPLVKLLGVQNAVVTGVIHCLKNKAKADGAED